MHFYSEKYKSLIICGENELILLSKDGINSEQKHIVQDSYFSSTSGPSIYEGCYSPVLDLFVFISLLPKERKHRWDRGC